MYLGIGHPWSRRLALLALAILLTTTVLTACKPKPPEDDTEVPVASCTDDGTTLQLDCPALPYTNAAGKITNNILDYDIWAWNSFIAMNWPALDPSANNNQRGFPDLTKSFATAEPTDLAVWETLKEKREVFLADPFTGEPVADPQVPAWNAEPQYGPADAQVPCCPGATCDNPFERHAANNSGDNNNTGDETAEVASEARESMDVLCAGHDTTQVPCNPDPPIGGAVIHGSPVGPRVWAGQPTAGRPLIYEVKVNWDFYNYVGNFTDPGPLWVQTNARTAAPTGSIRLPARTSVSAAPPHPGTAYHTSTTPPPGPAGTPGPNPIVTNYSASGCLTDNFEQVTPTSSLTPCPAGSVHLKAAWMPLTSSQIDSGKFHTSEVLFYTNQAETSPENPKGLCKRPAVYGLVGLHIIQRIHSKDPGRTDQGHPQGGTFIFATWEHVDNDSQGFTYANLYPTTSDEPQPYPNVDKSGVDAIPLRRAYTPLTTTQNANQQVHQALGCTGGDDDSLWCNYELIGVQYRAADGPPSGFDTTNPPDTLPSTPEAGIELPANSGQPYFLANLVVESNVGLQQFLGLPPATTPIDHYTSPMIPPGGSGRTGNAKLQPNASPDFDLTAANLAWRIAPRDNPAYDDDSKANKSDIITKGGGGNENPTMYPDRRKVGAYNMGGCMGCHGVAQVRGYSFSFVLLGNQSGAVPDTQTDVDIPPPPTN